MTQPCGRTIATGEHAYIAPLWGHVLCEDCWKRENHLVGQCGKTIRPSKCGEDPT
jgi:hypothetical protein